jgi:23S rRNA pseudouridine2605 synthase
MNQKRLNTQNKQQILVRLNKYIADCGVTSRRKADELILNGKVKVNNETITELGYKIDPEISKVFINGQQITLLDHNIYIAFNKPKDCITTSKDERGRTTVMDYVKVRRRVYPVGRLDRDTTGIIILTNDGQLTNFLMHPRHEFKKSYIVSLDKPLAREHLGQLRKGIQLDDGVTERADVHLFPNTKNQQVGIVIHEGKNRQVRRMFESLSYEVKKLDRFAFGEITHEGLKRGEWRYLTKNEINYLLKMKGEK